MQAIESDAAISIGGWVRHPLQLGASALNGRTDRRSIALTVVCTLDGEHGGPRAMEGIPLCGVIEESIPAFDERTDFKRVVIVAESVEGYRALFSWNELFNTPVGEGVMIAWPEGQPHGPYALVSLGDRATGPRYVKRLAKDLVELKQPLPDC
jgi:hypothetical protein